MNKTQSEEPKKKEIKYYKGYPLATEDGPPHPEPEWSKRVTDAGLAQLRKYGGASLEERRKAGLA
ncbi:MAG: hypothetical protein LBD14_04435 [Puniceicoccales bacterium]|nr:hypothetical protein [Puniceicoccales bacterium]